MLRRAFLIFVTVAIAIGGGASSVWFALQAREGVGAVTIGGWTAYPDIGTPDSDPYTTARVAREGLLALGRAEGLSFVAQRDSKGDLLQRQCSYVLEGSIPSARFWTLYAADGAGAALGGTGRRSNGLHSYQAVRLSDDTLVISVGSRAAPGNWLRISGAGQMLLVLTLYDTPIASSAAIADVDLPQLIKAGCDE